MGSPALGSTTANGSLAAPSGNLLIETGLRVVAEAAFYFVVGLGLASLIGSRAFTIGFVLAWHLVVVRIVTSIGALGVFRALAPDVHFLSSRACRPRSHRA